VSPSKLSRQLQRCLQLAHVTRADLSADDATRKPMTFHDLRATGITWCAMRGDDALKIKQRAGHATFSTTEGYIREAENLREANFGAPFAPLPASLLSATPAVGESAAAAPPEVSQPVSQHCDTPVTKRLKNRATKWRRRESKAVGSRRAGRVNRSLPPEKTSDHSQAVDAGSPRYWRAVDADPGTRAARSSRP
jgi:hypothetical protein